MKENLPPLLAAVAVTLHVLPIVQQTSPHDAVALIVPLLVVVAVAVTVALLAAVAVLALLPWERFRDHQISSQTKGG